MWNIVLRSSRYIINIYHMVNENDPVNMQDNSCISQHISDRLPSK